MNSMVKNVNSKTVRRLSGLALILIMACNPLVSMAAGKSSTSGGSAQKSFYMTWNCDARGQEDLLPLISDPIPAGKQFVANYAYGTLVNDNPYTSMSGVVVRFESFTSQNQWVSPVTIPTLPAYGLAAATIAQPLTLYIDSSTPDVFAAGFNGILKGGTICNVTLVGHLEDL